MKTTAAVLFCLLAPLAIIAWRVRGAEVSVDNFLPETIYEVDLLLGFDGHGDAFSLSTYLPTSDSRQEVLLESQRNADLVLEVERDGEDRVGRWFSPRVEGHRAVEYTARIRARHFRYEIPEGLPLSQDLPSGLEAHLAATQDIQVGDPDVARTLAETVPEGSDLRGALRAIFDLTASLRPVDFKGTTDALTALRLGEASCNGKSRLFVALARRAGIPARLVGGVILGSGAKRTSHQWVEAYVSGYWVPFCPTNGYFAEIPGRYLTLYHGDQVLFRHTADVNFDYLFRMRPLLISPWEIAAASSPRGLDLGAAFARIGVPMGLLKIVLLLPLGFLVTVLFRHVLGIETLGLFLPVLIAAAARQTGLAWGLVGLLMVVLAVGGLRFGLERMRLLRLPKMGVLLTSVVASLLAVTVLGVRMGLPELAHVSLFPLAILTITVERVSVSFLEEGFAATARLLAGTIVVIGACYVVLASVTLQSLFLAFPELLLMVAGLQIALGRWIGLRVSEHFRFRSLLFKPAADAS